MLRTSSFLVKYPEDPVKTNDIILKVQSYGGNTYSGGKGIFRIECSSKVKRKLKEEIKDMLKS